MIKLLTSSRAASRAMLTWTSTMVTVSQIARDVPAEIAELIAEADSQELVVHVWKPTHTEVIGTDGLTVSASYKDRRAPVSYCYRVDGTPGTVALTRTQAWHWLAWQQGGRHGI